MATHNSQQFSTYDRDNDMVIVHSFIKEDGGIYNACCRANLNGPHTIPSTPGVDTRYTRLMWNDGRYQDISSVEMKIRVKQCLQVSETC